MDAHTILTSLAFGCLGWKVVTTIHVVRDIDRRGVPVNRWLVRIVTCAYAGIYRRATLEQSGRVAPLFFVLIASTAATLAFTAAALATRGPDGCVPLSLPQGHPRTAGPARTGAPGVLALRAPGRA